MKSFILIFIAIFICIAPKSLIGDKIDLTVLIIGVSGAFVLDALSDIEREIREK